MVNQFKFILLLTKSPHEKWAQLTYNVCQVYFDFYVKIKGIDLGNFVSLLLMYCRIMDTVWRLVLLSARFAFDRRMLLAFSTTFTTLTSPYPTVRGYIG